MKRRSRPTIDTARWVLLAPCAFISFLLTSSALQDFCNSIVHLMLGGAGDTATDITLIVIKLLVGFTSMFFVALSIAPSHKREVFRGACVFSAAIAVVIAMMSAADGNPLYRMPLPFISAILACGVTRRFMKPDRFGTGIGAR